MWCFGSKNFPKGKVYHVVCLAEGMHFILPLFALWMQEITLRGVKYALIVLCFCLSEQYLCKTGFLRGIYSEHY